jgi:hypothetical protein
VGVEVAGLGTGAGMVQRVCFCFRVCMVEVYNETVLDLLLPRTDPIRYPKVKNIPLPLRRQARMPAYDGGGEGLDDPWEEKGHSSEPDWEWTCGAAMVPVDSPSKALQLLHEGLDRRVTAATSMNQVSSRGHVIFTVVATKYATKYLHQQQRGLDTTLLSDDSVYSDDSSEPSGNRGTAVGEASLRLVDLAGSERTRRTKSEGVRLKEAQHINVSLCALKGVIEALATNAEARRKEEAQLAKAKSDGMGGAAKKKKRVLQRMHVPYRDSKLTMLLRGGLGGDGISNATIASASSVAAGGGRIQSGGGSSTKTSSGMCLLLTVSSCHADASESLSTLRFGECANKLTAPPSANKMHLLSAAVLKSLIAQSRLKLMRQQQSLAKVASLLRRAHADTTMVITGLQWAMLTLQEGGDTAEGQGALYHSGERGHYHNLALTRVSACFRPKVLQSGCELLELAPGYSGNESGYTQHDTQHDTDGGSCNDEFEVTDGGRRLRCLFAELGLVAARSGADGEGEASVSSSVSTSITQWLLLQAAALDSTTASTHSPTANAAATAIQDGFTAPGLLATGASGSTNNVSTSSPSSSPSSSNVINRSAEAAFPNTVSTRSSRCRGSITLLPDRLLRHHLSVYLLPADIVLVACCSKSMLHGAMGGDRLWKRFFLSRFVLPAPHRSSTGSGKSGSSSGGGSSSPSRPISDQNGGGGSGSGGSGTNSTSSGGSTSQQASSTGAAIATPVHAILLAERLWALPVAARVRILELAGINTACCFQQHSLGACPAQPPAANSVEATAPTTNPSRQCQCQCWIRLQPVSASPGQRRSLYISWFAAARRLEWERVLNKWRESRAAGDSSSTTAPKAAGVRLYPHT